MPPLHPQRSYSVDDYFSVEEGSTVRHEFFNGEIFAMAGGTVAHNTIAANVLGEIQASLKGGPCRVLGSDMRLLTPGGLLTYPDLMVLCAAPVTAHGRNDVVTNPVILVEVLSDATRAYDLGEKFELYKEIGTLTQYLAIEQRAAVVQSFSRTDAGWDRLVFDRIDLSVPLPELRRELAMADVYDKVFDTTAAG